jgi:hypothetical protein
VFGQTYGSEQDLLDTVLTSRLDQVQGERDSRKDVGEEDKLESESAMSEIAGACPKQLQQT